MPTLACNHNETETIGHCVVMITVERSIVCLRLVGEAAGVRVQNFWLCLRLRYFGEYK